ncbi:hypothetical protein X797_012349 [Metarhizium robertsii]|uniref:RGS domain-containing protein n=1 Tax=Metarhizium robertsii TaxID=568076 RepID=A0A014P070_9HYPO|nr:hypothetical protein X797_012349 [Metarhizium robertsii]
MDAQLPTLDDILLNNASPPWTLRAFAAYLNQHRCLEVLQFVFDADRYATCYEASVENNATSSNNSGAVDVLWRKLMQLYIYPSGRRQLNIPEREREHLLHLPSLPPPHPSELREACRCAYDLLNDSLAALFHAREPMNPLRRSDPIPRSTGYKSRGLWRRPGRLSCDPELESQATNEDGNSSSLTRRSRYAFITNVKRIAAALGCAHAT